MKYVIWLFVMTMILLSCGDKGSQVSPSMVEDSVSESYDSEETDSAAKVIMDETPKNKVAESATQSAPSTRTYSSSSRDEIDETEYDNMRGFDPASEDDMDDNGMSRYMENDDEEGWD